MRVMTGTGIHQPLSEDEELELLLALLDESTKADAETRLRRCFLPRIKDFVQRTWILATPSEVEKLGEWVIASFAEGVLNGAINGDERLAVSMIRIAKMGIREYNTTLDEIKDASSPHYESADLWFNWTLIQTGGLSTEFKREIRDWLASRSDLHLQVLRVMCDTGGQISGKRLVEKVRENMGQKTAVEILSARNELRNAVCKKIEELRKRSK